MEVATVTGSFFPAGHALQEPVSGHILQAEAPTTSEYLPNGQSRHEALEVAPSCAEYVPALQSTQLAGDAAPAVVEYVPVSHFVQEVEEFEPPAIENLPTSQSVHLEAPLTSENEPALQSRQACADVAPL